jgi:hypothetical protein
MLLRVIPTDAANGTAVDYVATRQSAAVQDAELGAQIAFRPMLIVQV